MNKIILLLLVLCAPLFASAQISADWPDCMPVTTLTPLGQAKQQQMIEGFPQANASLGGFFCGNNLHTYVDVTGRLKPLLAGNPKQAFDFLQAGAIQPSDEQQMDVWRAAKRYAQLWMQAGATKPNWVKAADEGGSMTFTDPTTVMYGAAENWIARTVAANSPAVCGNEYFGGDPAFGVVKTCVKLITAPVAPVYTHSIAPLSGATDRPARRVNAAGQLETYSNPARAPIGTNCVLTTLPLFASGADVWAAVVGQPSNLRWLCRKKG